MVTIGEMARRLGVSVPTMRRWDREGHMKPASRTVGNHRRYALPDGSAGHDRKTIIYARVSSHDQKSDLERQKERLVKHAAAQGWEKVEAITDLGSGMNCKKGWVAEAARADSVRRCGARRHREQGQASAVRVRACGMAVRQERVCARHRG